MPVELIWLAGVVAVGAGIVGSALYSEASEQYRRRYAKSPALFKPARRR
jgi:hypothetical protein